jgi:nucleotide-binding universal stress UspA family protein
LKITSAMEEQPKLIVVPWDFSHVADHALAHAAKISRMVNNNVCLLHIVDPAIKPAEEGEKKALLKSVAEENGRKYNMPISTVIAKGSIFTAIADFVNQKGVEDKDKIVVTLVVMGTHGMKGMQKLTGSWALKVIVKSTVPFIVVQEPPVDQDRYHNIVFPWISGKRQRKRQRWRSSWVNILIRNYICSSRQHQTKT